MRLLLSALLLSVAVVPTVEAARTQRIQVTDFSEKRPDGWTRMGRPRTTRTSPTEHASAMEQTIHRGSTPSIALFGRGLRLKGWFRRAEVPTYRVSGLKKSGTGAATFDALISASGHVDWTPGEPSTPAMTREVAVGPRWAQRTESQWKRPFDRVTAGAKALEYAATNQYDVVLTRPDGSVQRLAVPSTGLVTPARLTLELDRGVNVLTIAARGSGGPGGFRAGRTINLERK